MGLMGDAALHQAQLTLLPLVWRNIPPDARMAASGVTSAEFGHTME
jgi:hypothetical protein